MPIWFASIPWWIKNIPTLVSLIIEVTKFLMNLKDKSEAQSCGIAVEEARKKGDMVKLEELITKMKAGKKCD
jgi:hypothetical protein